jgi:hypothetical protein
MELPPGKKAAARKAQPVHEPDEDDVLDAAVVDDEGEVVEGAVAEDHRNVQAWPDEDAAEPLVAEPDEPVRQAPSGLRWSLVLLYVLGILGLGGITAVLYLPEGTQSVQIKGVTLGGSAGSIRPEARPYFLIVPGAMAGLILLGLVISLVRGRFGWAALLTAYPVVIASGAALVLLAGILAKTLKDLDQEAARARALGGTLTGSVGMSLYVGIGAAAAATLFFSLAILLTHRRTWARILFTILAVVGLFLGGALVYAAQSGS